MIVWCAFAAGLFVMTLACSDGASLRGTVLEPSRPAPPFQLTNHHGEPVGLADHRGSVVALTFLYTSCPDICPIVAAHLRQARLLLGDDAGEVALVAVSVDPDRDSVEAAYRFSEKWQMLHEWDFLVGDEEQLSPIWKAYYVVPTAAAPHSGQTGDAYTVSHAGPVYLVDRAGTLRALFTLPFQPEDLVHDIRLLMAEKG